MTVHCSVQLQPHLTVPESLSNQQASLGRRRNNPGLWHHHQARWMDRRKVQNKRGSLVPSNFIEEISMSELHCGNKKSQRDGTVTHMATDTDRNEEQQSVPEPRPLNRQRKAGRNTSDMAPQKCSKSSAGYKSNSEIVELSF